jgi:hypothetical protein
VTASGDVGTSVVVVPMGEVTLQTKWIFQGWLLGARLVKVISNGEEEVEVPIEEGDASMLPCRFFMGVVVLVSFCW